MILFKKEFVPLILNGTKTQTRRKSNNRKVGSIHQCKTDYYSKPFASIRITNVEKAELRHVSYKDALAEGFECIMDFYDAWAGIHGVITPESLDEEIYVIDFELVEAQDDK